MGEIIPFPVWMIQFPVLKINFEPFGSYEKHFVKDFFDQRFEVGKIIPFPVRIRPFPVLKINFEPPGSNEKHFVK